MKYAKLGLKTSIKDNFGARMRILARLRQRRSNFCKKWGAVMVAFKVVRGVKVLKDIKVRSELSHALSGWCLDVAEE